MMTQIRWYLLAGAAALALGCVGDPPKPKKNPATRPPGKASAARHADHEPGPHGGVVFDLGKYHGEFVLKPGSDEATLYVLDDDEKTPAPIAATQLDVTLKSPAVTVEFKPQPLPGEPNGKSSRFVGKHEAFAARQSLEATVIGMIDGKPSEGRFEADAAGTPHSRHKSMPKGVGGTAAERELFLTPGGIYTEADIDANGRMLPSRKFAGISWPHDDDLKTGDKLCPVTANKADPRCVWIVNGNSYEFCCTPCLDKFVKWAKTQPDRIKKPEEYIYKE
jgi:hypothetical protein